MRQWFYVQGGQQQGPIPEPELIAMFASGRLQADVLVWTEGLGNWSAARDIENLVPAALTPPLIPATARATPPIPNEARELPQKSALAISGFGWYLMVFKKYAVFEGRARRKEYWMFQLFNFVISICLLFVDNLILDSEVGFNTLYSIVMFIPSIAVTIRRMHDINQSGWYCLIPVANLIFVCTEGTRGNNRFGADPKAGT